MGSRFALFTQKKEKDKRYPLICSTNIAMLNGRVTLECEKTKRINNKRINKYGQQRCISSYLYSFGNLPTRLLLIMWIMTLIFIPIWYFFGINWLGISHDDPGHDPYQHSFRWPRVSPAQYRLTIQYSGLKYHKFIHGFGHLTDTNQPP